MQSLVYIRRLVRTTEQWPHTYRLAEAMNRSRFAELTSEYRKGITFETFNPKS